jgi:hypothetical protein
MTKPTITEQVRRKRKKIGKRSILEKNKKCLVQQILK